MNTESILKQFALVEKSITRAKLPFETDMLHKEVLEVTLYELIKAYHQIDNLVREIDPGRFGSQQQFYLPPLDEHRLFLCPHCGNAECQSDHK